MFVAFVEWGIQVRPTVRLVTHCGSDVLVHLCTTAAGLQPNHVVCVKYMPPERAEKYRV